MSGSSYKRIGAVRTSFELLEYLSNQNDLVTGKQIAEALGVPVGTVMCHLATLADNAYVSQVGEGWRIGTRMSVFWARVRAGLESRRNQIDQVLVALGE